MLSLSAACVSSQSLAAGDQVVLQTPNQIVAAAPASDWVRIAPDDLLVMDLAPGANGKPRRVVIQLISEPFSQGWTGNIRKLAAARWYDGISVVRVQDNYVVQWGDPDGEVPGKAKPLPDGLQSMTEAEYEADASIANDPALKQKIKALEDLAAVMSQVSDMTPAEVLHGRDPYALVTGFEAGLPVASDGARIWPTHCYGSVGVGRNISPDTGTGAELYAVIGHAPRQLDRNIAVVGRVIAGIEHLSSLPRGTGELGFYETPAERTAILAVRMGKDVSDLPAYEYLSTASQSFAVYMDKRANRKDDFYIQPADGVDICNVPVPIRVAKRVGT
ncbi:peptidylprolyl isomerase [Novosphingobium sp. 2580]|uniref:peptidylprolyl isomerase n=1 Tax=Novosphingobium album (ex Hu et al. 2023) TaxID=2930093 RepID=A0ABT0B3S9_9SPHN|nr:peptidylprolyl isomerase [Novosphingobium album (ex Hu et al. 2023)]MCJ2179702.1 peptidylprolyl isomerase [Novosphingobium album (ex Hu et al. 2023)]